MMRAGERRALGLAAGMLAAALIAALLVVAGGASSSALPGPVPATEAKAPALFTPDQGRLRILVGGQQVGKEEFQISASGGNWVARGNSEIQAPEGVTHVSGTLELHADGSPVRYEWATQGAKKASATIAFNGPTASIELHLEGARPYTQQFTFNSSRVAILDNNLYHQYALLARLYDWDKKGAQTIAVLVPQDMTPGTVTVESVGSQDFNGKKVEELRVRTEDLEIHLFLDGPRLVRLVAPSSNVEIVRE